MTIQVVPYQQAIQYDGGNGADVAAALGGAGVPAELVSDTGGVLTLKIGISDPQPYDTGRWFVWGRHGSLTVLTEQDFHGTYVTAGG